MVRKEEFLELLKAAVEEKYFFEHERVVAGLSAFSLN